MNGSYKKTMNACFVGYIVQAIVNNFVPLLFITFQSSYQIPLSKITMLITINFVIQLLVDLLSAGFIDKIGYRASIILAHICSAAGLILLTVLPDLFSDAFIGLLIAVVVYAVGGGLIEVLISQMCIRDSLLTILHCRSHRDRDGTLRGTGSQRQSEGFPEYRSVLYLAPTVRGFHKMHGYPDKNGRFHALASV